MTKKIEDYYDFLSSVYDQKSPEFWRIPHKVALEMIIRNSIFQLWNILDIWCWTWNVLDEIIWRNVSCEEYRWIDISQKMIDILNSKYPDKKIYKLDIEENDFPKEYYPDTVFAIWIFEFIHNPYLFIEKIKDLLYKWWLFCFTFENLISDHPLQKDKVSPVGPWIADFNTYRYTFDQIKNILGDNFEIVDSHEFTSYYKTAEKIPVIYTLMLLRLK